MSAFPLTILLVLDDGIDSSAVEHALPPGTRSQTVRLSQVASAPLLLDDGQSDMIIVGSTDHSDGALALIESASRQRPERPVVVLYAGTPNGFMERAFEAGADDLITLPLPPAQLGFALEKALVRRRGVSVRQEQASVVTVLGPKGGTGKTLTSCNLAVALAMRGERPVVVDLDLQFGDIGLALGLRPERTIYDLAVSGGSIDAEKVDGFLMTHDSGARALLAPLRPDQASAIDISLVRSALDGLQARYGFVIIDTPPGFTPEVIACIDASSQLCVVGSLDALSLKDTKIGLETLARMGYDPKEVVIVLNRSDTNVGISDEDVERLLGRAPDVLVPSDRAIPRLLTQGRTIVAAEPRSGAGKAFQSLADTFAMARTPSRVESVPEPARRQRRLLLRRGDR